MKKTKALITSLLMLQASCLVPLYAWTPEEEGIINNAAQGHRVINKRFVGFQGDPVHIPLDGFIPFGDVPANLGTALPRVAYTVENQQGDDREITFPRTPLQGRWINQENWDNARNQVTFVLEALVNNTLRHVRSIHRLVDHELVRAGAPNQDPTQRFYNGHLPYPVTSVVNTYRIPGTQTTYNRTIVNREGNLPGHDGEVIFCQPFAVADEVERDDYRENYQFLRDLNPAEQLQNRESGRLMYARDGQFYLPTVTQELWGNDRFQAGFFIASFLERNRLNILRGTQFTNGNFDDGLYQMVSFTDRNNHRHERWQRLGEDAFFEIVSPGRFFCVQGIGATAPYEVPEVGTRDFNTLRQQINEVEQEVQRIRALYEEHNPQQVIVIGPTGSGKSTLITGLFRDLFAQYNEDDELRLLTNDPLPGFTIGAGGAAGTRLPSAHYDGENNILYWDCPGFGDPAGAVRDLINAFAISNLFSNNPTKIVLNANDGALNTQLVKGKLFYDLLNKVAAVFPEEQEIRDCLSLFVTKGNKRPSPVARLNRLQRQVAEVYNNDIDITPAGRNLLTFLHQNPERVAAFLAPQEEGPYLFNRGHIQECLARANFITPLTVNLLPNLTPGTREQCAEFAQNLNQYLFEYLRTEGAHRLFHHCRQKMDAHQGSAQALRTQFRELGGNLEGLANITPEQMIQNLRAFSAILADKIDVNEINQTIDHINFLRQINPRVTYTPAAWYQALSPALNKIQRLSQAPVVEISQDGFSAFVKGIFLGSRDIQAAINAHPNRQMNAFAGYKIFLNGNLTHQGRNLMLSSPLLSILQPTIINLSGLPGANGADGISPGGHGKPGHPGGSSGHFYGNFFDIFGEVNNVTVRLNGGKGGKGGNGARGSIGNRGNNGCLNVFKTEVRRHSDYHNGRTYYSWREDHLRIYGDKGLPGQRGGNGGCAGSGGKGGKPSYGIFSPNQVRIKNIISDEGGEGKNGTPGPGGQGGKHGKDCKGLFEQTVIRDCKGFYKVDSTTLDMAVHVENNIFAENGLPGSGINMVGRQQPVSILIDANKLNQLWQEYYDAVATDENISPFISY